MDSNTRFWLCWVWEHWISDQYSCADRAGVHSCTSTWRREVGQGKQDQWAKGPWYCRSWKLLVTVVDPRFGSDLPFAVPTVDPYAHISRGTPERSWGWTETVERAVCSWEAARGKGEAVQTKGRLPPKRSNLRCLLPSLMVQTECMRTMQSIAYRIARKVSGLPK